MGKKNKNYSKVWELEEGGYAWVLFIGDDPKYYTGTSPTETEAQNEIKWITASNEKKEVL